MDPRKEQIKKHLAVRWSGLLALCLCLLALPVVFSLLRIGGRNDDANGWVWRALTSRLFVTCAIVSVIAAVVLSALGWMLVQAGAFQRRRRRSEEGSAMLEFALVLPIALMLVLIMAQSTLLMTGNLYVHNAAFAAARNAIVTVPANFSIEETRNVVADGDTSEKRERIRQAGVWAMVGVSCSSPSYRPDVLYPDLREGLGNLFEAYGRDVPQWLVNEEYLSRKLGYAEMYTNVELAPPENGSTYGDFEDLLVRLEHTLYLSVPYANALFAKVLVPDDGRELDFAPGEYGLVIRANCRLVNNGVRDFVEVEQFPHRP